MIATLVMVVIFLALAAASVWSLRYDGQDDAAEAAQPASAAGPAPPSTLEGALVGQLLDRQISAAQYRREMGRLAERDAGRHPMSVPPDPSSSAA